MKLQYLCHLPAVLAFAVVTGIAALVTGAVTARAAAPNASPGNAATPDAAAPGAAPNNAAPPEAAALGAAPTAAAPAAAVAGAAAPIHDYPTVARVEYVNECIAKSGGKLAAMYQCSCAIDRIANALSYDDYVEASTYSKYATLTGAGGGIFRDSELARRLAKSFRDLEADALRGCGLSR